ncbi:MAG TPA: LysR family transcriptional regulator [Vicinamibacterales bacterium]|jgi:DNA-binding transcriptional LysR family regulator|nr:LysR family transcriptional regulator [Vicinamibacterales bacterium]
MRDDLSGLRALLCVAEKRGFRAAAAELRLTPSAVSQAVRALEERVGVQLLRRTTRSVGLTEAGEHFVGQVRPAMNSIGEAFEALGEARDRPAGNLRLTVPRLSAKRLVRVLEEYCAPFPGYFLYYPSRAHIAPKLRAFVDFMRLEPSAVVRARATGKTRARKRR